MAAAVARPGDARASNKLASRTSLTRRAALGSSAPRSGVIARSRSRRSLSILLILVFVGKEALPLSHERRGAPRGDPRRRCSPRDGREAYVWQPVSEVPEVQHRAALRRLAQGHARLALLRGAAQRRARPSSSPSTPASARARSSSRRSSCWPAFPRSSSASSRSSCSRRWVQTRLRHRAPPQRARRGHRALVRHLPHRVLGRRRTPCAQSRLVSRGRAIALGSTPRRRRVLRVVLPAAAPGIAASVVLGFGRADRRDDDRAPRVGQRGLPRREPRPLDAHDHRDDRRRSSARWSSGARTTTCSSPSARMLFLATFGRQLRRRACRRAACAASSRELMTAKASPHRSARRAKSARATASCSALTAFACVVILAMLVVVVGDVVLGGSRTMTWEFVSAAPRERHDGRWHLPRHLRHGRAHAADDRRRRPRGCRDGRLPDRVRLAARLGSRAPSACASPTSQVFRPSSSGSSVSASSSRPSADGIDARGLRRPHGLRPAVPPLGFAHARDPHAARRRRRRPRRRSAPCRASFATRASRSAPRRFRPSCASCCPRRSAGS